MRSTILAAAALMCSASALAQTTEATTAPDPSAAPEASTTTGTSATITSADPATSSTATGGTTAAPTTGASMSTQTFSAGGVDIAAHDTDRDGSLTPLEFAEHVSARSGDASMTAEARRERYSRASGNGAIRLLNSTADDFGAADRNRDRRVDSTELAMWQSGGMSASAGAASSAPITSGAGTMSPAPSSPTDTTPGTSPGTTTESSTSATTGGSGTITSGAGSPGAAPDTSATMDPSTSDTTSTAETPPDDMADDLQNSTDPNESTTAPPPTD